MAQFVYEGEAVLGFLFVASYGTTNELRIPTKTGTQVLSKPGGYPDGQLITDENSDPVEFTDPTTLRELRADPRFTEQ